MKIDQLWRLIAISILGTAMFPTHGQAQTRATLRVLEAGHEDRLVDGQLEREATGEKIPIVKGQAVIKNWKPQEKLRVYPKNTERYASPHFDQCPLPATNIIHVRTRLGNQIVIDNAAYLETRNPLLAAYANYLVAGRLKTTGDTPVVAAARTKSVELLAKELGVPRPIKEVKGTTVELSPDFENALRAFQRRLGVSETGEVDYKTLKAANKDLPASVLVTESAHDFTRRGL